MLQDKYSFFGGNVTEEHEWENMWFQQNVVITDTINQSFGCLDLIVPDELNKNIWWEIKNITFDVMENSIKNSQLEATIWLILSSVQIFSFIYFFYM